MHHRVESILIFFIVNHILTVNREISPFFRGSIFLIMRHVEISILVALLFGGGVKDSLVDI